MLQRRFLYLITFMRYLEFFFQFIWKWFILNKNTNSFFSYVWFKAWIPECINTHSLQMRKSHFLYAENACGRRLFVFENCAIVSRRVLFKRFFTLQRIKINKFPIAYHAMFICKVLMTYLSLNISEFLTRLFQQLYEVTLLSHTFSPFIVLVQCFFMF